jgi:hypothetical protein
LDENGCVPVLPGASVKTDNLHGPLLLFVFFAQFLGFTKDNLFYQNVKPGIARHCQAL